MVGAVGDDDLGAAALAALAAEGVELRVADRGRADRRCADHGGRGRREPDRGGAGREPRAGAGRRRATRCAATRPRGRARQPRGPARRGAGRRPVLRRRAGATFVLNPAPPSLRTRELLPFATCRHAERERARGDGPRPRRRRGRGDARPRGRADLPRRRGRRRSSPRAPFEVVDTTGAGDCFNGVLAAGCSTACPWRTPRAAAWRRPACRSPRPARARACPPREEIDAASADRDAGRARRGSLGDVDQAPTADSR